MTDDPYLFGQIAAANALSDVYAMGGEPKLALNLAAFPNCLDTEILWEILKGGADKVMEAGAVLAGGHTISDNEPKYGLCVTGFVHPKKMWKNCGAEPGDLLVLTKPLGSGILSTAEKGGIIREAEHLEAVKTMTTLNKYAAELAKEFQVHCCTDITGFGLAGHAMEMAKGSKKTFVIYAEKLPVLSGAREYAEMGLIPAGAYRNREFLEKDVESRISGWREDLLFDPQTSGGLLLAMPPEDAAGLMGRLSGLELPSAVVGEVTEEKGKFLIFV